MAEQVQYAGWKDCLRLANEEIELIVTREVGPRIIRCGFVGERNEFREFSDQVGRTGGDEWRIYGGHRLWHAPEARPRSYQPDNDPVSSEELPNGVRLIQTVEAATGVQKALDIQTGRGARVTVTHRLMNQGMWPLRLAPWALTVMAPGGCAIIPQSPHGDDLLPDRSVVLWPYTAPDDPRLAWGRRYLRLIPEAARENPVKIGTQLSEGWCAYVNAGHLFLKCAKFQPDEEYPDFNSSVETYAAGEFLELETLAPLVTLEPGASVEHIENWFLFRNADASDEDAIDRTVLPRAREATGAL
jgi:hypothetical protein